MAAFSINLKVIDDRKLRSLMSDTGQRGQAWATETAENILARARELMEEPKSGIHYPSLPNQSSAPGEAPAVQSGALYGSGEAEGRGLSVIVGFSDEKAVWMELGTSRIAPRPFLRPAFDEERPKAIQRARKIVEV